MPRLLSLALIATLLAAPLAAQPLPEDIADLLARGDHAAARSALAPLAEAGETPDAMYRYGALLYQGQGGPVEREAGLEWMARAAQAGHDDAAVTLARILLTGPAAGVVRNPEQAAALLAPVAERGGAEGAYYLGLLHLAGTGVAQDAARAEALLTQAAEAAFPRAQWELSRLLAGGPDPAAAMPWLRAAAEAGVAEAQMRLAVDLDETDPAAALAWYRRAADGGVVMAQRELGTRALTGAEGIEANPSEALRWLTSAAEAGDRSAMHNLAVAYGGEHGIPADPARALSWYARASEAGLARASYALAQYLEAGLGSEADLRLAAQAYRLAGEQGDPRGFLRLGRLTGQGALDAWVPPHLAVDWTLAAAQDGDAGARTWLEARAAEPLRPAQTAFAKLLLSEGEADAAIPLLLAAAEAGDVEAQHLLALAHSRGEGVPLDYVAAHTWSNVAATGGHPEAAALRETIGALMTPDQIAEAQTEARAFFDAAAAAPPPVGR
ncbi:sel1 repeat family protein [Jannaschia sp.]|nr:sel1 repeat family protein [Jannaschia sp.]MDB2407695.1 sel1 repeat family protein [Jannaschia sp.]